MTMDLLVIEDGSAMHTRCGHDIIAEIRKAGQGAKELVNRLCALSGSQMLDREK